MDTLQQQMLLCSSHNAPQSALLIAANGYYSVSCSLHVHVCGCGCAHASERHHTADALCHFVGKT